MDINNQTEYIIITSQSAAAVVALNEVQRTDTNARLVQKLTFNEQLVHIPMGYERFVRAFKSSRNIFIRHMFPVTYKALPDNAAIADNLDKSLTFAIQARSMSKDTAIGTEVYLIEKGFRHNHKLPEQVVSMYGADGTVYVGLSYAKDNISIYNGGMHRFKRDDIISRAEFKILEAIADFEIALTAGGRAIDLGAAPGGFSKVLLDRGFCVTAVDPADLDPRVAQHERLTHFKGVAECFASDTIYDFLTNDMKMDVAQSVKITNDMSRYLKTGGQALMTLKLTDGGWLKKVNKALDALKMYYTVKDARQLFNNRSEVTVWLEKK